MLLTNYHTHTTRCQHAVDADETYVLQAINGGYSVLGFSDHSPWPSESGYISPIRMTLEQLDEYIDSLKYLRKKYEQQIKLYIGMECEYFPDRIDWLRDTAREYAMDYLIFGNHFYKSEESGFYFGHATRDLQALQQYLESAIKGMECGLFAYMAHPDLFMRSYPVFDKNCEKISRQICRKARQLNCPLEYNFSYIEENERMNITTFPHPEFWKIAADEGCQAIIGVDAHAAGRLSNPHYYLRSIRELEALGIHRISLLPSSSLLSQQK